MQHKHITIQDKESGVKAILYADVFAQSAFDNDVGFDDFKLSMDMFCNRSVSSVPQIYEWRYEATEIFFGLLEKAGKLKFSPTEFLGGSDYEEDNGTAPDIENK